ncbi:uncharacterized protein [Physcomitrium patens]|uniref:Uncharacterized protein n=1 Tax=Physcomitrium patens TaxID=3218 RepID=A0A2K1JYB6_PHYPA|nr:uncharacterized protein LOC112287821 [Physcomitrium patens]PNR46515.1 hypothetical protein PHYPA_013634 [Physcomitrium patens]|eukprot:XP_024387053.1 uncharacterized protein LOC112287821 [Physcomitrella patens]
MARIRMSTTWVYAIVFVLLLLLQTPHSADAASARQLRGGSGSTLVQEAYRPDRRLLNWSDEQAGHDVVPTPSQPEDNDQMYRQGARFLIAELHADYTEPAANPSVPYTGVP